MQILFSKIFTSNNFCGIMTKGKGGNPNGLYKRIQEMVRKR